MGYVCCAVFAKAPVNFELGTGLGRFCGRRVRGPESVLTLQLHSFVKVSFKSTYEAIGLL